MQDHVAQSEFSRVHFDKRPLSIDWNDVPVSQSMRHSLITVGKRNGDLLGQVVRFLSLLLHLSAVVELVGDHLSTGLARLGIDDKNFVAQLDL